MSKINKPIPTFESFELSKVSEARSYPTDFSESTWNEFKNKCRGDMASVESSLKSLIPMLGKALPTVTDWKINEDDYCYSDARFMYKLYFEAPGFYPNVFISVGASYKTEKYGDVKRIGNLFNYFVEVYYYPTVASYGGTSSQNPTETFKFDKVPDANDIKKCIKNYKKLGDSKYFTEK